MALITHHTQTRLQQRGVQDEALQMVLFAMDRKIHLGSGCIAAGLSREKVQRLREAGLPNSVLSRAEKLTLLINDAGVVITVLKGAMVEGRRTGSQKPKRGGKRGFERKGR